MADVTRHSVEISLEAATREYVAAMKKAEAATKDFTQELDAKKVTAFGRGMAELQKGALAMAAAVAAVSEVTVGIVEAGLEFNKLISTLTVATGSAESAAQEFAYLAEISDELGLSLREVGQEYAKFAAATRGTTIEGEQTREVFEGVSAAVTALGLSSDEASGIFTALTQILSKGRVQSEELTGQIGERLPGALAIAARAMGVTTEELVKMLEQGQVLADDFLPKFARQLQTEFGDVAEQAAEGPRAAFNRLNNAIYELQIAFAQSGLLDAISTLAEWFSTLVGYAGNVVAAIKEIGAATAFWVDATTKLFQGDFAGIARGYEVLQEQTAEYWREAQRAATGRIRSDREGIAILRERGRLEQELASQQQQLADLQQQQIEQQRQAEIAAAQEVLDVKIDAAEDALRAKKRELDEGLKAEQKAVEETKKLRESLTETLASDEERLEAIRNRGRTAADAALSAEQQATRLLNQARRALREGDTERAARLAEQAKALAEQVEETRRAVAFFEEAASIYRKAKEAEIAISQEAARAQQQANEETRQSIEEMTGELDTLRIALEELTAEPQVITIDVEISAAKDRIRELQQRINELDRGRAGGGPISLAGGGAVRHLGPGMIRGPGTGTSDSILARVSAGEHAFITRASRAKKLWPLLNALNFGSDALVNQVLSALPGGLNRTHRALSGGSYADGGDVSRGLQPVNIYLPGQSNVSAQLFGERDQVTAFQNAMAHWSRGYTS